MSADRDAEDSTGRVVRFPRRPRPPATGGTGYRDLGVSPYARSIGLTQERLNGHWCSRCVGIWFGGLLEAECPVCGNRHG